MPDAQQLYEQGVTAVKAKDMAKARQYLKAALKSEPNNERAWLWMARAIEGDDAKLKCVERALKLNPFSQVGLEMHRRLLVKTGASSYEVVEDEPEEAPPPKPAPSKNMPIGKELASASIRIPYQLRKGVGIFAFGLFVLLGISTLPALTRIPGSDPTFSMVLTGLGGFGTLVCLWTLVTTPFGKSIRVFENGVVYGGKEKGYVLRWHELDNVVLLRDLELSVRTPGVVNPMSPFYDMGFYKLDVIKDGTVVFSVTRNFQDFREIGALIRERSQPALVDRYLGDFQRKGQLEFGSVKLTKSGLSNGTTTLTWKEVYDTKPYATSVVVETAGKKSVTFKPKGISGNVLSDVILGIKHSQ